MSDLAIKNEIQLLGPIGSIEAYISIVNQAPVLTKEEEHALAVKFKENNDLDAARQLVLSQLRFVVHIARTYSGYGLPLADIIQEGNVGLMKAVKKFDPDKGVRLVTYAVHWIRAEIHEFVFDNWKIVKVATTKAQRKLFFKLRNSKKKIGWLTNDEKSLIANDLGVKTRDVETMEQRLASKDVLFDRPEDDNDSYVSPAGFLPAPNSDPSRLVEKENWLESNIELLSEAMDNLDNRSKEILKLRWLTDEKHTLKELAMKFNVSLERVRQIEEQAILDLRENSSTHRPVRSFVRRKGRITSSQKSALKNLLPKYGAVYSSDMGQLSSSLLGNPEFPLIVDIGFGDGELLVATAEDHAESNFIGIEVYDAGIGHCLKLIEQRKVNNLKLISRCS